MIGLTMQKCRLVRVKRWVEPEPTLGRKLGVHVHVSDQKSVVKDVSLALESEQRADRAARAIGDDQPVAVDRVLAVRRGHAHFDAFGSRLHVHHLVAPAELRSRKLPDSLDQECLDIVLLQIDERGSPMTGLGEQVELEELLVAEEDASHAPAHALFDETLCATKTIEDFER